MGKTNRRKRQWAAGGMLIVLLLTGMVAWGQKDADAEALLSEFLDPYAVAAEAMGITVQELEGHLEEGGSVADVARQLGVDPNTVVTALTVADGQEIDQAVASGEIDETEALLWRDESIVYANEFVYIAQEDLLWDLEEDWDDFGFWDEMDDDHGDGGYGLGYDEDGDYDHGFGYGEDAYAPIQGQLAVESQRAMAYSLLDNGMDPYLVLDAVFDAELVLIEQIQDPFFGFWDLDEWAFDEDFGFEDFLDDEAWDELAFEDELATVISEVLGIAADEIWDAVDEGTTLAQLAEAKGIDPQALVDRLVAEDDAWIEELVADGELDEDEAAEWREETAEFVRELVFEPWF